MRAKNLTEACAIRGGLIQELEKLEDARQSYSIDCEEGRATPQTMTRYRDALKAMRELEDELALAGMEVAYYEALREAEGWDECMTFPPCSQQGNIDFEKCEREKARCLKTAEAVKAELDSLESRRA